MKKKLILTSLVVALAAGFYSFKSIGEKESNSVALVMSFDGKGDDDGYMILYGDGSSETVSFKIKYNSPENAMETAMVTSKMMNAMHEKGYRFAGTHITPNSYNTVNFTYMIFEKK